MNPFAKGALPTKDAFQSNDLKALLNRLRYLVNVRGVGVFTASPGMGKSYGIRCFRKELNENLYKVVYLCLTTISVAEFYRQICDSLGLDVRGGNARTVDNVMSIALTLGAQLEHQTIDAEIIMAAINEITLD